MSVSIIASDITQAANAPIYGVGKQCRMADGNYIHFTPEVAKQWLPTITEIANEKESN